MYASYRKTEDYPKRSSQRSRGGVSDIIQENVPYNFTNRASHPDWKTFQLKKRNYTVGNMEAKWISLGDMDDSAWSLKSKDVIPTDYVLSKKKPGGFTRSSFASIESFLPVSTLGNTKSDIIALNNMLPVTNFLGVVRDLELSGMWDMISTALVELDQNLALVFKVSKELHINDLKLLTSWAQTRLGNPELSAAFATKQQIREWNAVKRESQKMGSPEEFNYLSFVTARSLKLWSDVDFEMEKKGPSKSCTPELATPIASRGSTSSYSHSSNPRTSNNVVNQKPAACETSEVLPSSSKRIKLQIDPVREYPSKLKENIWRKLSPVSSFAAMVNDNLSGERMSFPNSSYHNQDLFPFPNTKEKEKEYQHIRKSPAARKQIHSYSPKALYSPRSEISDAGRTSYARMKKRSIKCLFIEIRGVLVTTRENYRLPKRLEEITPKLAKRLLLLKNIIFLSRCKLILIGTARGKPALVELVNRFLKAWEISPFYSVTASLHKEKLSLEKQRVKEVQNWLDSRDVSQCIKSWCVVDVINLRTMNKNGQRRLVRVNPQVGLTRTNVASILEILKVELELYK